MSVQFQRKFLVHSVFIIISISVSAQENIPDSVTAPTEIKNAISFVPQYAAINGMRFDYEKRMKNQNHWIVFALQVYADFDGQSSYYYYDGYYNNTSYETMTGHGLNIYFKKTAYQSIKINSKNGLPRSSLYLEAGPSFQHYSLKNNEEVAVPFVEDGITYYEFELQDVKRKINRFGGTVDIGWQVAFDWFLIDMYVGATMKYSYDQDGELLTSEGYQRALDIDYSGILINGGVKFGIFF